MQRRDHFESLCPLQTLNNLLHTYLKHVWYRGIHFTDEKTEARIFIFIPIVTLLINKSYCCCSVAKSCPTLCHPINCSISRFLVLHYLLEFPQTHVHWVSDAIQPSQPLLSPSPSALNLPQHQSLFQWVNSSHQVAKVLELQLQHQSFQWIFRVYFL